MTIWAWPIELGSVYWYWSEMTAAPFQNCKDGEKSQTAQPETESRHVKVLPRERNTYLNMRFLYEIHIYL